MNRRVLMSGLAASAAGLLLTPLFPGSAPAQAGTFSRIVVDTKPLEARGGGGQAAIIGPRLRASLQREFAGRIGRGGPALIVRVHTVQLSSFTGRERSGGVATDYLEAEVIAGGVQFPALITVASDSGGAWYVPGSEERRLIGLADGLASWVRRRV
jgi:hypothetical protein